MGARIEKDNHSIDKDIRSIISNRYKRITKAVNTEFWDSSSETAHSRYVGSYGRGTAINTSDIDVLIQLPDEEYEKFSSLSGNGPSRLLQAVKDSIIDTYPNSDIKADGQVVVVNFSDDIIFEILPAFDNLDWKGNWDGTFIYPDSHMGGNWLSTNPIAEIKAMDETNGYNITNGLLKDTCKHIRYIKSEEFSSYHLSGILIDSFIYQVIGGWHWLRENEEIGCGSRKSFEETLLDKYNGFVNNEYYHPIFHAPGSNDLIDTEDWDTLGKVLKKLI